LPYFFNGYRGLWAAGKDYSYMKLRNGSYLDYIPDWYPLGYMLVSYGREKFGDDFWKNVTHDAAAFKGGVYPLQRAIKKYSGENFIEFRREAFNHYQNQFDKPEIVITDSSKGHFHTVYLHSVRIFEKYKHFDANREYPVYINDSTLLYMKSTYNHIPAFMMKTGNNEKKIAVRSVSLDNYFAYHDGKVVYAAYRPDLRWNYRDYSELMLLDVTTGKEHRITKNTKYFSPDFSPDGKTIAAVQEGTNGKSDLHLLNAANGKLMAVIPNKGNLFYTYPKFYGNKLVSAVRNNAGKMSLALIDMKTGDPEYLLPFSNQPIVFPVVKNDTVYFSATTGMNDRLFAISLKNGKLCELSDYNPDGTIGNYQLAISDSKLAWVGFTAFGYKIMEADRKQLKWGELPAAIPAGLADMGITALKRDKAADMLATVKKDSLPVTKYSKSYHLLNFHSLIPNFNDPNYEVALTGENVLNTLQSQLSFTYNRDEGYKKFGFDAIYGALFPYISGGVDYTVSRRGYSKGTNVYWNETDLHGGLQLPLNFSSGKHLTALQVGSDLYYTQIAFQPAFRSLFTDRSNAYSNNSLVFSNQVQRAKQNIYPRLAQSIILNYKSSISGPASDQFLASASFYFPGLMTNHNLVISAAHQQKNKNSVAGYSNDFPFSRGYTAENLYDMNKAGVNYHFPIAYPDAGVANAFYLLRLRGNMFYDYTYATDFYTNGSQFKGTFRSTGAEFYFDAKLFNQAAISFGFRYSYLIDNDIFGGSGHNRFEVIVPVTIF
jgi:hypothetical protein